MNTGAKGVTFDIFWGDVEKKPLTYDFSVHQKLMEKIKKTNLKANVIFSFHTHFDSSNHTNDKTLPEFVTQMEESNPDIFSRNSSGNVNRSHISPWIIQNKIFPSKN